MGNKDENESTDIKGSDHGEKLVRIESLVESFQRENKQMHETQDREINRIYKDIEESIYRIRHNIEDIYKKCEEFVLEKSRLEREMAGHTERIGNIETNLSEFRKGHSGIHKDLHTEIDKCGDQITDMYRKVVRGMFAFIIAFIAANWGNITSLFR